MVTKRKRSKRDSSGSTKGGSGNKRKKDDSSSKSKTKKKSKSSSDSTSTSSASESSCMLYTLIEHLNAISSSRPISVSTIKAMSHASFSPIEGERPSTPSATQDDVNVNLILMAVYLLNDYLSEDMDANVDNDGNGNGDDSGEGKTDGGGNKKKDGNNDEGDDDDGDIEEEEEEEDATTAAMDANARANAKIVQGAIIQSILASKISIFLMQDRIHFERILNSATTSTASSSSGMAMAMSLGSSTSTSIAASVTSSSRHANLSGSSSSSSNPNPNSNSAKDVKNMLCKIILTTMTSTLSSMKRLSSLRTLPMASTASSASSSSSASAKSSQSSQEYLQKVMAEAMWRNLNTLERMLQFNKKKPIPSTSSSASAMNIPVSCQHAHQLVSQPQRLYEWMSLRAALDTCTGTGTGTGSGTGNIGSSGSASGHAAAVAAAEEKEVEGLAGIIFSANEAISAEDKIWMMPVVFGTIKAKNMSASGDTTNPPPPKRKRKAKEPTRGTSSVILIMIIEKFEDMLHRTKNIEGRIQYRKIVHTCFVHCCNGQLHLLDILRNLQQDVELDSSDMEMRMVDNDQEAPHLWKQIMKPGIIKMESGTGKKIKRKKSNANEISVEIDDDTGGHLALNIFASRIIELLTDIHQTTGNFAPTNGMREYIQNVWHASEAILESTINAKGKVEVVGSGLGLETGTIRSQTLSMVITVMRLMLLTHEECLKGIGRMAFTERSPFEVNIIDKISTSSDNDDKAKGYVLINEEETVRDSALMDYAHYHPLIHKSFDLLIKVAEMSRVAHLDSKPLYAIVAAMALKCSIVNQTVLNSDQQEQVVTVVDAKLSSFAVHHLSETLNGIISTTKQFFQGNETDLGAKDFTLPLIDQFLLNEPIKPDLSEEYAGIFTSSAKPQICKLKTENDISMKDGYYLGLFLRAMLPSGRKALKSVTSKTPLAIVEKMLDVVKCCYIDKRENAPMTARGVRKGCFTRCVLAADCLEAIRNCISCIKYEADESRKSIVTVRLRAALRKYIPSALFHSFIDLGNVLENKLIYRRSLDIETSNDKPPSSLLNGSSLNRLEFERWERRLWSAHIKCCLAFTRGNANYTSRMSTASSQQRKKSCIGTCNERLSLFKAVASALTSSETKWPLYMTSTHHALVSGNITCDPLPRTLKDAAPERFICEGFIESITAALIDPESTILNMEKLKKNPKIQISDEIVPLSLRDARLFAVALSRTPKKEQTNLMNKFVSSLYSTLVSVRNDDSLLKLLSAERIYSGFIARIITVCSNMLDMVSSGKNLLESLCIYVGPLHYHLPSISEIENKTDGDQEECVNDWYKRESCFMGLWPDWEMSSLPACNVDSMIDPLINENLAKFSALLNISLGLGFKAARCDMCHLAFAAWNASAKLKGFMNDSWKGPIKAGEIASLSDASKLEAIRNDIIEIHRELQNDESTIPDSYLSMQIRARKRGNTISVPETAKGVSHLKTGVLESIKMLSDISSMDNNGESNPGASVVAEGTLAYISFLTSMFTITDKDLLSALVQRDKNRRTRKNSSISGDSGEIEEEDASEDSDQSGGYNEFEDEEDEEEAHMDGVARLHHVCDVLGASPFHPDWLDESSRFRHGISETESVELAEKMLQAVTTFAVSTFTHYTRLLKDAISLCSNSVDGPIVDSTAVLTIIRGIRASIQDTSNSDDFEWQKDIANLMNIDIDAVQVISKGLPCKNAHSVKESFSLNSAHFIRGKLQDFVASGCGWVPGISEYRSGGEWELLLSDAIVGSCAELDLSPESNISTSRPDSDICQQSITSPAIRKRFSDVLRWQRLLQHSVSTMVTVNALLRFGLNGSKGRNQHMSNFESDEILSMDASRLSYQASPIKRRPQHSNYCSQNLSTAQLKESVNNALCVLAEVQSCGLITPVIQQSARSAACHLVGNDNEVLNLEGIHIIRNALVGMKTFVGLVDSGKKDKYLAVMGKLFESMRSNDINARNFETRFLFCLGSPIQMKMGSIVEPVVTMRSTLQNSRNSELYHGFDPWKWECPSEEIEMLVNVSQGQCGNRVDLDVRSQVILMIRRALDVEDQKLTEVEKTSTVKMSLMKYWKNLNASQFQVFIKNDICALAAKNATGLPEETRVFQISRSLSAIIVRFIGVPHADKSDQQMFKSVLKVLKSQMQYWVHEKELNHLICMICVLAVRGGSIKDIGKNLLRVISSGKSGDDDDLSALELFYRFLRDISKTMIGDDGQGKINPKILPIRPMAKNSFQEDICESVDKIRHQTTCSFKVTGGEFTEQHWYNCYTCGLKWDKGCCSLCARVCHKGHDVGYSRKSSFFCDCGAEVRTSSGRLSCKCLSTLSPAALADAYSTPKSPEKYDTSKIGAEKLSESSEKDMFWIEAVDSCTSRFPTEAQKALDDFKESVDNNLVEDLFSTFNSQFDVWTNRQKMHGLIVNSEMNNFDYAPRKDTRMINRHGEALELAKLERTPLSLLRASRSNVLKVKLTSDYSGLERSKKLLLAKNSIIRDAMVVDSRGRMIIAESNTLLFCAALPLVNTRHVSNPLDSPMDRSQLCILGTDKIDFGTVVGIALSQDRDRHLVSWGFTNASVHLLNKRCDSVDATIDLSLDLDDSDCESDHIIKAEWVTHRIVAVLCATSIRIFDIESQCTEVGGKKYLCQSALNFLPAYDDILIRRGVIIPTNNLEEEQEGDNEEDDDDDDDEANLVRKKIVLLFDSGRLHMLDLVLKSDGSLDSEGDVSIEYDDGLEFPITGARRFGGSPETAGTTSKSLGEGSCLVYLRQSGILLYKCMSSCVLALIVGKRGEISGSFEFLPHIISSGFLGVDSGSVSGPYTNWTELGTIKRDHTLFYRAIFVCRTTATNQAQPVYIEFNHESSKLKALRMPANASLSTAINSSFEGLAVFSGPIVTGNKTEDGSLGDHGVLSERMYLSTITLNGILSLYGEHLDKKSITNNQNAETSVLSNRRRALSDSGILSQKQICPERVKFKGIASTENPLPFFPLTTFEFITDVTQSDNLVFSGDAVEGDSSITKRKLSTGSNEYIASPFKDGCTFIVSLQPSKGAKKSKSNDKTSYEPHSHAIVAVRVLLGTHNTDFFPREIFIMGRAIKPTRDKKRWYDVPLTDEEIIIGVRSGFVSICISGSQDADRSPALIDAIEVYAEERSKLTKIFPISENNICSSKISQSPSVQIETEHTRRSLNTSILVISHMFQLLGGKSELWSKVSEESLQRLIQVTALDSNTKGSVRNHVIEMLRMVESDATAMQLLLDKGTLQGICNTLIDLESAIAALQEKDLTPHNVPLQAYDKVLDKVHACLSATIEIVKDRPKNYNQAIESFIARKSADMSIALYSKGLVTKCKGATSVAEAASNLVELIIYEAMYNSVNDACPQQKFAGLKALSDMLRSSDQNVIKQCCTTIAKVLKDIPAQVLIHVCDCCEVMPITRMRYTMDEYDIDLCQDCYHKGISYAVAKNYNASIPVRINDKNIHVRKFTRDLTCSEICEMTSKTVPNIPKDQLPALLGGASIGARSGNPNTMDEDDDDDVQLQIALKMSLEAQDDSSDPSRAITLRSLIFRNLLDGVVQNLSSAKLSNVSNTVPVLDLLLTLVLQCNRAEDRVELGTQMCKVFCEQISVIIETCTNPRLPKASVKIARSAIVLYLRALVCLVTKRDKFISLPKSPGTSAKANVREFSPSVMKTSKTDPRFVCEVHGVPAVRRRCSQGENENRRFYVCGMERKQRCGYFQWADELVKQKSTKSTEARLSSSHEKVNIDSVLQSILWRQLNGGKPPFHRKICNLLRSFVKNSNSKSTLVEGNEGKCKTRAISMDLRQKLFTTKRTNSYEADGVYLAHKKLGYFSNSQRPIGTEGTIAIASNEYSSVEAALELLSLVTSYSSDITQKAYVSWEAWYSPLCQIISKEKPTSLRSQAKKMLKCLCGGRKVIYHQIRDRFVFAAQFMELLEYCKDPLQAALIVRQKARQCGPQWRLSEITWATLSSGGLIGAQDLVSEDYCTISMLEKILKVLENLTNITMSRSENWRHFCALEKLPQKDFDLEGNGESSLLYNRDLNSRSPICLLLWMSCSLPVSCQVKLMQLMDVALTGGAEFCLQQTKTENPIIQDESLTITTDIGTDAEFGNAATQPRLAISKDAPEDVLLDGASGLSTNDLCAFTLQFILNGKNQNLRLHAKSIALRLLANSSKQQLYDFMLRMSTTCMGELAASGLQSIEFLQFLTDIVSKNASFSTVDFTHLAQVAMTCFVEQMATNYTMIDSTLNKDRLEFKYRRGETECHDVYDLSHCTYCQERRCDKNPADTVKKHLSQNADNDNDNDLTSSQEKKAWGHDQLSSYRKIRLDQQHTVSTEFSSYLQLKTRLAISEITVKISDQRGRFVKTIAVYFSPRPVNDVSELKDSEIGPVWQRCGTFSLPRGTNSASCKLPPDVVAANLKFEYNDFWEKITGPRTSSGAMVLHCPRCTRVVNNAHGGVCGHCGEVAFQCRKCRHINYDRLDAFLCVECGYCSSGSFSYELQAGGATAAVAILSEEDLERSTAALQIRDKKYNELQASLKKVILDANGSIGNKRNRDSNSDISDCLETYSSPLKRALLGELPKISISRGGADKKRDGKRLSSSPFSRPPSIPSASNRARSLLSLARQLRGDSGSEVRSSLGDLLVQQARLSSGARGGFPFDDDGDGNLMSFEMSDPLSRLVANIQARARGEADSASRLTEGESKRGDDLEKKSKKEPNAKVADEAQKYFRQMKGFKRDCNELRKRIIAWKRLNHDALADYGSVSDCIRYTPTTCSMCASPVALHLLELVHSLLQFKTEGNEKLLHQEFIRYLFDGQVTDEEKMVELKRAVLVTIAKSFDSGSNMIFTELETRLSGARDIVSAQILGKLLKNGVKDYEKFANLAIKTLEIV